VKILLLGPRQFLVDPIMSKADESFIARLLNEIAVTNFSFGYAEIAKTV